MTAVKIYPNKKGANAAAEKTCTIAESMDLDGT
jgi:hypothetical protein